MINVGVFIGWNWDIFTYEVCIVHRYRNVVNSKERRYEKSTSENNIFYFELSSKPNIDIIVIVVSMWKQHEFETILTSNYATNIKYSIEKWFGSRERVYYIGVNDYFGPRRTNRPHATPNYRPGKYKCEIDYYRHKYCYSEKLAHIWGKLEESGQEVMYYSNY